MRHWKLAVAAALILCHWATPTFADSAARPVAQLRTSGSFTAPVGFQIFCLTNRAFCRGGGAEQIRLNQSTQSALEAINTRVNRAIRPRGERQDIWTLGATQGDCEDYVLAKRAALVSAGLPASALRIAAVVTANGQGHAVLVVRTDQGDLVLDNLTSAIKPFSQTSLRWVAMTAADGRTWKRIA